MSSCHRCCKPSTRLSTSILALIGGLLSSSCCLVQLLLNTFSLGCGGFAVLEPAKPIFRALTAVLLLYHLVMHGINKRSLGLVTLVMLVAASQDLLALHNKGQLSSAIVNPMLASLANNSLIPQRLLQWMQPAPSRQSQLQQQQERLLQLHVEGMKCEGCAGYLRGQILQLPGITNCTVDFANKQVNISLMDDSNQLGARQVLEAIAKVDDSYVFTLLTETQSTQGMGEVVGQDRGQAGAGFADFSDSSEDFARSEQGKVCNGAGASHGEL